MLWYTSRTICILITKPLRVVTKPLKDVTKSLKGVTKPLKELMSLVLWMSCYKSVSRQSRAAIDHIEYFALRPCPFGILNFLC